MPFLDSFSVLADAAGQTIALGPDWLDANTLIERFGDAALIGIVAVIFIETGLLFPFLPGDSLLFTAGALVAQDQLTISLPLLLVMLFAAAFLGDQLAYFIGRQFGARLFRNPNARILKPKYIEQAHDYFERYGGRTIVLARFVPIVRTYAPVAAGMSRMNYRHFVSYNVIGALVWAVGVTLLGYALGNLTFVKENIEALLVVIVAISVLPMVFEIWRARRKAAREPAETALEIATGEDPEKV
ncbi:membrane-associated protein [Salana multivorans]|uniref:Membrane-associated protein n=1 Tax=Salana multivorans TaxID=120377 RepID=A0A3N2DBF0_9MICO|nr:VTT domain-containing protein [Salana multivorans]ROR97057.1 membrane-associated protein [Salana multivorans]